VRGRITYFLIVAKTLNLFKAKHYLMKLAGIKTEYTPKGRVKRITINANVKTDLVEDLIDTILYEERKDGEFVSQNEAMDFLRKNGKLK
jgi:hypothetical protein